MTTLKNLEDLFHHQLKDIYSAEKQLIKALGNFRDEAYDNDLKDAFDDHLEETKEHKNHLDDIAQQLDIDLSGVVCKAMQGLIEEIGSFISEDAAPEIKDAGLIAEVQRIEHYEISVYGTLVEYAKALNHKDVSKKLQKILDQEASADKKLSKLAMKTINKRALVAVS